MTAADKKRFVRELFSSVQRTVLENVAKMPEEWDGHELRQYIADKFDGCISDFMHRGGARKRAYENEIVVRNL